MKDFITQEIKNENAVLVGLITSEQNEEKVAEYLDELAFLTETAGLIPNKRYTQRLDSPNTATLLVKVSWRRLRHTLMMKKTEVGVVIFDDELSARQLRNIEKVLKIRIMDRTSLILDIFCNEGTNSSCQSASGVGTI